MIKFSFQREKYHNIFDFPFWPFCISPFCISLSAIFLLTSCKDNNRPYDIFDPLAPPYNYGEDFNRHNCDSKNSENLIYCYRTLGSVDCYKSRFPDSESRLVGCVNLKPWSPPPMPKTITLGQQIADFSTNTLGVKLPHSPPPRACTPEDFSPNEENSQVAILLPNPGENHKFTHDDNKMSSFD